MIGSLGYCASLVFDPKPGQKIGLFKTNIIETGYQWLVAYFQHPNNHPDPEVCTYIYTKKGPVQHTSPLLSEQTQGYTLIKAMFSSRKRNKNQKMEIQSSKSNNPKVSHTQLDSTCFISGPQTLQEPTKPNAKQQCRRKWCNLSSWWFQPIWKIFVKMDHFPK